MATPAEVINPITITNFQRGIIDSAYDNSLILGMLKAKGSIKKSGGGLNFYWTQRIVNYGVKSVGNYADVNDKYVPTKLDQSLTQEWGKIETFDALSHFDIQRNNGDEALVKFCDENIAWMYRSMLSQGQNSIADQFFNDRSGDADVALPLLGLGSINQWTNVANTVKEATVTTNATYAGRPLAINGSGVANAVPYALTPRNVNTDFDWDGDASADGELTKDNAPIVIGRLQSLITFDPADKTMSPDVVISDREYFEVGRTWLGTNQTIFVNLGDDSGGKYGLGSSIECIPINGIKWYWDANVPANTGYMLNLDHIKLKYLDPGAPYSADKYPGKRSDGSVKGSDSLLFHTEVNYNDGRLGLTVANEFAGQFQIDARFQGEFSKHTA